jgi:hypothetical protein
LTESGDVVSAKKETSGLRNSVDPKDPEGKTSPSGASRVVSRETKLDDNFADRFSGTSPSESW